MKLLTVVFNFILLCSVYVMFVVGWLAFDKMTNYLPFLSSARISLYFLFVLGVCGIVVNVYCLVAIFIKRTIPNYVFVGILSALVLLQLVLALVLLVSSFSLAGSLHATLEHSILNQYQYENNSNNSARIQPLDVLQIEQDCCGAASFRDWADSSWFRAANNESSSLKYFVPPSCCIAPQFNCGYNTNINNIKYAFATSSAILSIFCHSIYSMYLLSTNYSTEIHKILVLVFSYPCRIFVQMSYFRV